LLSLPAACSSPLPASCFLLPASCFLLPASCFLLPASCFLLPASGFRLPASGFRLRTFGVAICDSASPIETPSVSLRAPWCAAFELRSPFRANFAASPPLVRLLADSAPAGRVSFSLRIPVRPFRPSAHFCHYRYAAAAQRPVIGMALAINRAAARKATAVTRHQHPVRSNPGESHAMDYARLHRSSLRFRNHDVHREPLTRG